MGSRGRTGSDVETDADTFFGQFVDAAPEVVAQVAAERGGDLTAVVGEGKAFGYWDRKVTARATRRLLREQAEDEGRARVAAASALSRPVNKAKRLAPLAAESAALLPPVQVLVLTGVERSGTGRWWRRLRDESAARGLARRMGAEVREGQRAARRAVSEAAAWRRGERVFEREQYREVIAHRDARPQRRIEHQWAAISEDRALAIALAAAARPLPPQGRF